MRTSADFAPQDTVTYSSLRSVIRRFNSGTFHEKAECIKVLQYLGASSRCLRLFAGLALGQQRMDSFSQRADIRLKAFAGQISISDTVPPTEQSSCLFQESISDSGRCPAALGDGHEVPNQMRPTDLAHPRSPETVGAVPVADQDSTQLSEKRLRCLGGAFALNRKHRDASRDHRPQPNLGAVSPLPPAGFIGMLDRCVAHELASLIDRSFERFTSKLLAPDDCAQRYLQPEQVS